MARACRIKNCDLCFDAVWLPAEFVFQKLLVATPAHGEIFYTPYVRSLLRLQRALIARKDSMSHLVVSFFETSEARNFLLTHWFDRTDASHLLFVDADMGFEPELVFEMLALSKSVVGVVYPKRQLDVPRLAGLAAKGEPPVRAAARAHDFNIRPLGGRAPRRAKGFLEVAACGAGILLIERSCVAQMLKKLPELSDLNAKRTMPLPKDLDRLIRAFDAVIVDGARLSDDFAFCHRWHERCGGKIWANIDAPVTHIGLHRFGARFADAGGGQRVQVVSQSLDMQLGGKAGEGLAINEGKGPKVVKDKLKVPKPAK